MQSIVGRPRGSLAGARPELSAQTIQPSRDGGDPQSHALQRFMRRVESVHVMSGEEKSALLSAIAPPMSAGPHTDLIVEGERLSRGYFLEEGWGCRYRLLNDGRRQILNFVVPGDYVGASGSLIDMADHSVCTLTPCRVYPFSANSLKEVERRCPGLREVFGWSRRRDLAMLLERIVDLGRRTARERVAHLLLELLYRLRFVGLSDGREFDLPLTQEVLADALGLSNVHVNRTLRRLTREKLIRYRPGHVAVTDAASLRAIAEFDEDYLHHNGFGAHARPSLREVGPAIQARL